jgi:hypothetical protein
MVPALRSSMVVLVSWMSLLAGCDMLRGFADTEIHGRPIAEAIEKEVGKKPDVVSIGTGSTLFVTVQFADAPSVPVPSLQTIVRAAIVHEFKKEPTMLTISFIYLEQPTRP